MEQFRLTRAQIEQMITDYYEERGLVVHEVFSHTGGYTITVEKKEEKSC